MSDFSKILRLNRFVSWMSPALTPDIYIAIHRKITVHSNTAAHIFLETQDRENWFLSCNCRIACTCTFYNFTLFFNKTFRIFIINRLPTQHIFIVQNREIQNDDDDKEEEEEKKNWWKEQRNHFSCSSKVWLIQSVDCVNTRLLPCLTSLFCCHESDANMFSPFIFVKFKYYIHISVGIFYNYKLETYDWSEAYTRPVAGNYHQINDVHIFTPNCIFNESCQQHNFSFIKSRCVCMTMVLINT